MSEQEVAGDDEGDGPGLLPEYVYFSLSDEWGAVGKFATRDVLRMWPILTAFWRYQLLVALKDGNYVIYEDDDRGVRSDKAGGSRLFWGCFVSRQIAADWLLRNEYALPPCLIDVIPSGDNREVGDGGCMESTIAPEVSESRSNESDSAVVGVVDRSSLVNSPSTKAWAAWRVQNLIGVRNQTSIAEIMTQQGKPCSQGQVSRYLKQCNEFLAAGGLPPSLARTTSKPQAMDPNVIDLGSRMDGRTRRQRSRRQSESDD